MAATNRDVQVAEQLAAQNEQLRTLFEQQKAHGKTLGRILGCLQGGEDPEKPGMVVRIDRLERTEARRRRTLFVIGTATVGLIVRGIWRFLTKEV